MKPDDVVFSLRCAGSVRRYHTWPVITVQTVADHSYHVLRLLRQLYPEITNINVIDYVLWHDLAEIKTGDIPFPVKKDNPKFRDEVWRIEAEWYAQHGMDELPVNEDAIHAVKICDLVEMAEYALHEMRLGNQFARPVYDRVVDAVMQMGAPQSVREYVGALR